MRVVELDVHRIYVVDASRLSGSRGTTFTEGAQAATHGPLSYLLVGLPASIP